MARTFGVQTARSTSLELDRHPDAPRRSPWREWAETRRGPIAVDLFSGAGGLTLGLENAGYTVVLSADHDPASVRTHLANFPGQCLDLDLSDPDRVDDLIGLVEGLELDLVAGGPPCQPFSRAGRSKIRDLVERGVREPIDPRRELWRPFLRVIEETRPRAVLMENVPDMALGDEMRTVRYISDRLESIGYETDMRIVEAWRHGVPQHRQRLILVALRDRSIEWPEPTDPVSLREAISDLPELGETNGDRTLPYGSPEFPFQKHARRNMSGEAVHVVYDHMTRAVRPDDREAFALMGEGLRYRELPARLKRYRDDIFDDKYNRLSWDDRSRSITAHIAKDGYWYIHPSEHRTLTVREAARIQTFPDDFRFSGSRSDAFRQIGNAVPPVLAETIARSIRTAARKGPQRVSGRSSAFRSDVRAALLAWAATGEPPPWRDVGHAWDVLVGTIAGQSRQAQATEILKAFPNAQSMVPQQIGAKVRSSTNDRERRVFQAVGRAGTAIKKDGWESGSWAKAASLRDADRQWVETVGLGQKHIAANTATLRVAARVMGQGDEKGVGARMVLAQLVGHSEASSAVTAALAGLGSGVCRATEPNCGDCPLSKLCRSRDQQSSDGTTSLDTTGTN